MPQESPRRFGSMLVSRVIRTMTGQSLQPPRGTAWVLSHIFVTGWPGPGEPFGDIALMHNGGQFYSFTSPVQRLLHDHEAMRKVERHAELPKLRVLFDMISEKAAALDPEALYALGEALGCSSESWARYQSAVCRPLNPPHVIRELQEARFVHGRVDSQGTWTTMEDHEPVPIEMWIQQVTELC